MSDIAVRMRSERRLWAVPGSSHDRVVRWLRVTLPIAIGALLAFMVTAPLAVGGDVSFVLDKKKVEVARERLRVQSPVYRGEDARGRDFMISAGSAVQKSSAEPVVQISDLSARIALTDGPATLDAAHARYDLDKQQVKIDSPVQFRAADGYSLQTTAATVDLNTRRLKSDGPVEGTVPLGTFSARNMTADLEQRVVTLNGNARLRIKPRRRK